MVPQLQIDPLGDFKKKSSDICRADWFLSFPPTVISYRPGLF